MTATIIPATTGPAGPFADPRPAMRGHYLIRNPSKAQAMALVDAALGLWSRPSPAPPSAPQRILVADWGHLGDVVTTFGAIAALRQHYPDARVDMIAGAWGRPAIAATGLVDTVHIVDHWAVNRSGASFRDRFARYRRTRTAALDAMRRVRYDLAIDFYPFFPPAHPLFHHLGIPVRIGFDSGGMGPLLSHRVQWRDRSEPMATAYRDLLCVLDPAFASSAFDLQPRRDPSTLASLPTPLAGIGPFIVLHPGAGAAYKDWGLAHWQALAARLRSRHPDHAIVLTGAGVGEAAVTAALARDLPRAIDLAGRVDWEGFVATIAHASLVICPDTATGHVAALFDIPVVTIFTGTNETRQWAPFSDTARVVTHPVLCAPCYRTGCATMACIRSVTPDDVLRAVADLFPISRNNR